MKKVLFFIVVFVVVSYIITHYTKSNDVAAQQTTEQQTTEVSGDIVKIVNTNYTTSFSKSLKYPVKVEWWLTKAKMCIVDRQEDHFCADPKLPESDLVIDYKGCGKLKIDRGHMCPSADNRCSETLQTESCYFSNVAPQYANLNRGKWLRLEELSRKLATANDSIHIWAGSKGSEGKMNSVTIPRYCWKVIYIKKLNKYRSFVFENTNNGVGEYFVNEVTKDSVERFTGFKF